MDLKQLDTRAGAERGFDVHLKSPATGADLGIIITVRGADSAAYQDKASQQAQARLERNLRRGKLGASSPDEMRQEALELLAAMTTGWHGLEEDGAAVPFSEAAALRIYDHYPWLREQIDAAIHDRANFLPPSAKAS